MSIGLGAVDDALFEGNEDYGVAISNASSLVGGTVTIDGVQNSVNTTINDNDSRPTTADSTVSTNEDLSLTFAPGDFPFADADLGDTLQAVTIVSLPTPGTLTLGGVPVIAGQVIPVAQLGTLVFDSLPDESGPGYATVRLHCQ